MSVLDLYDEKVEVELTQPEPKFGDFACSVALMLASEVGRSPREIAQEIADKIKTNEQIANVDVAGPGFINIKLTDKTLLSMAKVYPAQSFKGKVVLTEYSDPNPFKVLHAGHLYTTVAGDAISKLFEAAGAKVHRVNFGGDVGLHVGRTMWAILQKLGGENPEALKKVSENKRADWLADAYVKGTAAYEDDEKAKKEIIDLNKKVYQLHKDNDHKSEFAQIYWTTREWSYQAFDAFYARLGTKFDKYYPESEVTQLGLQTVKDNIGKVYEESDGAVVFKGEEHDLHTRVFINREGLPTYEAKDVGLIMHKQQDFNPDLSVILTGNEQEHYLNVVMKSIEQFNPDLVAKTKHIHNGLLKMSGGEKMSSRKGNILKATDILDEVKSIVEKEHGKENSIAISLGAIRYALLKNRIGGDIHFDIKESVSLQGNSGPYLQYAHARARSILSKTKLTPRVADELTDEERTLVRKISEYSMVVDEAALELAPHKICTFLFDLAHEFNRFYEGNRIVGDSREGERLTIVNLYADTLKHGLQLLGIEPLETM